MKSLLKITKVMRKAGGLEAGGLQSSGHRFRIWPRTYLSLRRIIADPNCTNCLRNKTIARNPGIKGNCQSPISGILEDRSSGIPERRPRHPRCPSQARARKKRSCSSRNLTPSLSPKLSAPSARESVPVSPFKLPTGPRSDS